MKLIVFDVNNGSCALAVCANGNSLMLDCGSHSDLDNCPVEQIIRHRKEGGWLEYMKDYKTQNGVVYPLTCLGISHPDDDHIKNVEKVLEKLTPYLLSRRYVAEFPDDIQENIDKDYKEKVCERYTGKDPETPDWEFERKQFSIPMEDLENDAIFARDKLKNNSSIIYLIEYNGFRALFGGDMEKEGWEWLLENDEDFISEMQNGVDVFIVPHHGHQSGFSQKLFDVMGSPKLSILSKGTEHGDETDVTSQYSAQTTGCIVESLEEGISPITKYALSTRANGNIYINVLESGDFSVAVEKGM